MSILLSNRATCLSTSAVAKESGRPSERAHDLGERRVGEHLVEGRQGRRLALEVERQPHALVLLAGVLFQRLPQILVDRRLLGVREGRGRFAESDEVEGRHEGRVALVRQLVCRARRVARRRPPASA